MTTLTYEPSQSGNVASKTGYRVQVVSDLADFDQLADAWDAFMAEAQVRNLCMSHAWLRLWLRYFRPDELLVLIVQDDTGRWVGAAPLKISRSHRGLAQRLLRQLQFIGSEPTVYDWMKFAVAPDADEPAVISAIADALKNARWDVLDLMFCKDNRQIEMLCQALGRDSASAVREGMPIPYVELPATEADYEKKRRKKTRLEVNRHRNRFAKEFPDPLLLEFLPLNEASEAVLNRFFAGHTQYWAEKGHKSDFQRYPDLFAFYKDMLATSDEITDTDKPRLLFSLLRIGEHQLSYHLGFWQGDSYLSHLTHFNQGFRSYSPGTIHMDGLVFDTIRRGGVEFEFGRGDEPYKKMWTQTKKPLWNLRIFRHPVAALLWQVDGMLKKMLGKAVAA